MPDLLKGNYKMDKPQIQKTTKKRSSKTLTDKFEESALAKLGGSMCFVMKGKTFLWSGNETEEKK